MVWCGRIRRFLRTVPHLAVSGFAASCGRFRTGRRMGRHSGPFLRGFCNPVAGRNPYLCHRNDNRKKLMQLCVKVVVLTGMDIMLMRKNAMRKETDAWLV